MEELKNTLIQRLKNELDEKYRYIKMRRCYTNERFSLLDALPRQHYEDLHSNILAYLLDPHASHDCGGFFLERFIKDVVNRTELPPILETKNFLSARVITEKYIGKKTKTSGGRIDIIITGLEKVIIIENKIFAKDQDSQLVRYNRDYPESLLLYLTPFGKEPGDDSITINEDDNTYTENAKSLEKGTHFDIISYSSDILDWLKKCREKLWKKQNVTLKLTDYITLLENKILKTDSEINMEMKETLLKPENIEILKFINADTIIDIRLQSRLDFLQTLFKRLNEEDSSDNGTWRWVRELASVKAPTTTDLHKKRHYGFQTKKELDILNNKMKLNIEAQNELGSLICGFFINEAPDSKKRINEFTAKIKSTDFAHLEIENNRFWLYIDVLKGYSGYKVSGFYSDSNNYLFVKEKDKMIEYALRNINHIYNSYKEEDV